MKNQPLKVLGVAALVAQCLVSFACSSASNSSGAGGSTGTGTGGGSVTASGGSTGAAGSTGVPDPLNPGSCIVGVANPDSADGKACAADCQSGTCGRPCSVDCCVTCGIDQSGAKTCTCPVSGQPYNNCSCIAPADIPAGLHGGNCSPQGYSTATPPATAAPDAISIRGMACKTSPANIVCFTVDSNASSERGCICKADGIMHCGSVNHWFTNDATTTLWMP